MANISSIKLPDGFTYDIKDNSKSTATNWLNGSQTGSLRTIGSAAEDSNYTIGSYALAEGQDTKAKGNSSHAEGVGTQALGKSSHAEGGYYKEDPDDDSFYTTANGISSHAEGGATASMAAYSHAEGYFTTARGGYSHAEGCNTKSIGVSSHAEGDGTTASGSQAHAQNLSTIAQRRSQTAIGEYNIADTSGADGTELGDYAFIIGNGTDANSRSNALTVDWSGNGVFAGKITVGSAPTVNMDVVTKKYVDDAVGEITSLSFADIDEVTDGGQ